MAVAPPRDAGGASAAGLLRDFAVHGSNTVLVLLSAACVLAWAAGFVQLSPLLVAVGGLLFYLTEYGTHRFMFHAAPSRWRWLLAKQHRLHYDHHLTPTRLDLLFLPLWYVLPSLAITAGIARLLFGSASIVTALVLGAMLALLHYEWVHLIAHRPYVPITSFGRWMKAYHLKHHFHNERLRFGVSNPLMDVLHGTFRDRDPGTRSRTTRVLYPGRQQPK